MTARITTRRSLGVAVAAAMLALVGTGAVGACSATSEPAPPGPRRGGGSTRVIGSAGSTPGGSTVSGADPSRIKVMVAGDSQAYSLSVGGFMSGGAMMSGITVSAAALLGCGVARGPGHYVSGAPFVPNADCETWPDLWRRNYAKNKPDISLLEIGAWEVYDRTRPDGTEMVVGTPEWQEYLRGELQLGIDILGQDGKPVVLVKMPCYTGPEPLGGPPVANDPKGRVDWVNWMLEDLHARNPDRTRIIDMGRLLCPGGTRVGTIQGIQVTGEDQVHFAPDGTRVVFAWLLPQLREILDGWVPPGSGPVGSVPS